MKILAVNGSPRGKKSNTDKFLLPFLKGASKKGADVEEIYLSEKNITGCQGCFGCWIKTPGKCLIKDDMTEELMQKINEADVLIFATPLYFFNMTGQMKIFVDRLLPLFEPFFTMKNGKMGHPRRREKPWKVLLFSNQGFINKEYFDILVDNFNIIAKALTDDGKLDAVVLRTLGETIPQNPLLIIEAQKIYNSLEKAGKEYATRGEIPKEIIEKIEKNIPHITVDVMVKEGNKYWGNLIEKNKVK